MGVIIARRPGSRGALCSVLSPPPPPHRCTSATKPGAGVKAAKWAEHAGRPDPSTLITAGDLLLGQQRPRQTPEDKRLTKVWGQRARAQGPLTESALPANPTDPPLSTPRQPRSHLPLPSACPLCLNPTQGLLGHLLLEAHLDVEGKGQHSPSTGCAMWVLVIIVPHHREESEAVVL